MKQAIDKYSIHAFSQPGRVRPHNPTTKSPAQSQREYHQRKKFNFLNLVTRHEKSS